MPKSKYKFNPGSLDYVKVELTLKQKVYRFLTNLSAIIVVSTVLLFTLSFFIDFPQERKLRRELNQMTAQYEYLNMRMEQINDWLDEIQERDDNIYRVIFEAEPIPGPVREAGFGGINRYADLEGFDNSELVIETTKQIDIIFKRLYVQSKSYDEVVELAKNKEQMWASIPAIQPCADKDLTRFASGFGYRIHPIYKTRKMHTGVDLTAPIGTNVYATGDGTIINAGYTKGGYGKRIIIDHGFGYKTVYAHLDDIKVNVGQKVKRGDNIGTVGNTGRSTAPHLHYEVRYKNKPINPVNFYFNDLTPEEYDEMIEISARSNQSFD